jgi:hypothetical protein
LFERMFLDNILVEYKKNPEIVFNEESQLLTLKTVFDLDRDLTTNFNRLFSRFWLCENPTHNQVINKEFKCCKCYSFVCPGCTIINTNVERDNVCIMCSVKYTDEQLNEIIPN